MQRRLEVMPQPLSADESLLLKQYLVPTEFMTYTLPNVDNEKRVGFISGSTRNIARFAKNGDIEDQRYEGFRETKVFLSDKGQPETFTSFIASLRGERMNRTFVSIEALRARQAKAEASSAAVLNSSAPSELTSPLTAGTSSAPTPAAPPAVSSIGVAPPAAQPAPPPTAAPAVAAPNASSASAASSAAAPPQQPDEEFFLFRPVTTEEKDLSVRKLLPGEFFCCSIDDQAQILANDRGNILTRILTEMPYGLKAKFKAQGWKERTVFSLTSRMPKTEADNLVKMLYSNEYTITIDTAFNKGDLGPGLITLFQTKQGNRGCFDFDLEGRGIQFDQRNGWSMKPDASPTDYPQIRDESDRLGLHFVHPLDLAKRLKMAKFWMETPV